MHMILNKRVFRWSQPMEIGFCRAFERYANWNVRERDHGGIPTVMQDRLASSSRKSSMQSEVLAWKGLDHTGGANVIADLAIQHLSNKNGISHASRRAAAASLY